MDKQEKKQQIARQRLIECGLSEELLDSKDIITDKYAIIIGWNGVVWHWFKPEVFVSVSCDWKGTEFENKVEVKPNSSHD